MWPPDISRRSTLFYQATSLDFLTRRSRNSEYNSSFDRTQGICVVLIQDRETAQVVRRLANQVHILAQGDQGRSRRLWESANQEHAIGGGISTRSTPILKTVKFSNKSSPPGRVQPALPTGTQGEEEKRAHGIGVPPPLVGRLGASGESGSPHKMSDRHSTTRV